jgi:hypothetical protein
MSDDPGRLRLGKGVTSFVKTQLMRLPQTEDVWQADFQPFPEAGKVRGRRRPHWLGVVLSQTDDFILADEILYEPQTVNDLAPLLADDMRRPLIDTARRPARIVLRDNPLRQGSRSVTECCLNHENRLYQAA